MRLETVGEMRDERRMRMDDTKMIKKDGKAEGENKMSLG